MLFITIVINTLLLFLAIEGPILLNEAPKTSGKQLVDEWERHWGGIDDDYCGGLALDSNGNIYLGTTTYEFELSGRDIVILRYNYLGEREVYKIWRSGDDEGVLDLTIDYSDYMYIVGYKGDDILLIKSDNMGVELWNRTWAMGDIARGYGVKLDSSNNIYLVGLSQIYDPLSSSLVLLKYNANGVLQWYKTWNGTYIKGYDLAIDSNDDVYVVGGYNFYRFLFAKYDSSGNHLWNKTIYGNSKAYAYDVEVDSNDNVYVTGEFSSWDTDVILMKFTNQGFQEWNTTWWHPNNGIDDIGYELYIFNETEIYIVGSWEFYGPYADEDDFMRMFMIKFDDDGNLVWGAPHELGEVSKGWGIDAKGKYIEIDSLGNIYVAGETEGFNSGIAGVSDIFLLKYGVDTDEDDLSDTQEIDLFFTNPADNDTDNDGLSDGSEVWVYQTNPLDEDTDEDGLKDGDEVLVYHTNPKEEDTDRDGFSDYDEVMIHRTSPINNLSNPNFTPFYILLTSMIYILPLLIFFINYYKERKKMMF